MRPTGSVARGGSPWPARVRSASFLSLAPIARLSRRGRPRRRGSPAVDTKRFPQLVRLLLLPEEAGAPEGAEGREGPSRVPEDLLGAARPHARAPPPTSSRTTSAPSGSTPTSCSPTRTRRARRPGAARCWRCSAGRRRPRQGRRPRQPADVTGGGPRPAARSGPAVRQHGVPRARARRASRRPGSTATGPACPTTFTGAELQIAFDAECRFAEGGIVAQDLRRAAAALVTRPEIALPARQPTASSCRSAAQRRPRRRGALELLDRAARRLPPRRRDEARHARDRRARRSWRASSASSAGAGAAAPVRVSLAVRAADASGQTVASAARERASWPAPPTARSWRPGGSR